MVNITREQAQTLINAIEKTVSPLVAADLRSYIAQLEANQRQPVADFEVSSGCVFNDLKTCPPNGRCINAQPVSDEKLRGAIDSAEFAPESMFGSLVLLPKQQWDVITSALSEHVSNKLPMIEEPAATLSKNALHWWMNMSDADLEEFQELPAYMQESIKRLVFYAKQRIESALPTTPAQEV